MKLENRREYQLGTQLYGRLEEQFGFHLMRLLKRKMERRLGGNLRSQLWRQLWYPLGVELP